METIILVNGTKIKPMVMVFMNGLTVTGMKVSGNFVSDMVKDLIHLIMETSILVNITTEKLTVMDSIDGQTVTHILAYSKME